MVKVRILGIETSCDETAAAIYTGDGQAGRILGECLSSQVDIHARHGGIVPEIASREHLAVLPGMVEEVMREAGIAWHELDAIAVTAGPGLMGALLVGVSYARAAGAVNNIPVLPIHHMEAHLLAPGLEGNLPAFPFVSLLVSGGHTMLVRVDGIGTYKLLGQTLDDAAGECFDKTARLLGLPYPGGPAIAELAEGGDAESFPLPRPLLKGGDLNFSFSGLKTAVMHIVRNNPKLVHDESRRRDLAAAIQLAVVDVLVGKCKTACRQEGIGELIVAGGVAANALLRAQLATAASEYGLNVHVPSLRYCTDNAAMIAYAGCQRLALGLLAPEQWDAIPRWPLTR